MFPIKLKSLGCVRAEIDTSREHDVAPLFSYVDPASPLPFPALQIRFFNNAATLKLPQFAIKEELFSPGAIAVRFKSASDYLPSSFEAGAIQRAAENDDRKFGQAILEDLLKGFVPDREVISQETCNVLNAIANESDIAFDVIVDNQRCDVRPKSGRFYPDVVVDAVWDVLLHAKPTGWVAGVNELGRIEARKIVLPFGKVPTFMGGKAILKAFFSDPAKVPARDALAKLDFFGLHGA